MTDVDAARERTCIVLDTVVGDLNVVAPPVYEDAATTLRAVGDGQAIDTRRVAPEVAGEAALSTPEIATRAIPVFILIAVGEQNRSIREPGEQRRIERIRWEERALGQDRNGGSFECAHQARLLQQFGQVAVEAGLPAHSGFQRQTVDLRIVRSRVEAKPSGSTTRLEVAWRTVGPKAEEAINPCAPIVQLASRVSVGIYDAGGSTDALQPDWLPHQDQFDVGSLASVLSGSSCCRMQRTGAAGGGATIRYRRASRIDHKEIAWLGSIDCGLDGGGCCNVGWGLATDGHSYGVNRCLAAGSRDRQLTAMRSRAAEHSLLLDGAQRYRLPTAGEVHCSGNGGVGPTYVRKRHATDRDGSHGIPEAIVPQDGLLVVRSRRCRRPRIRIVSRRLIAQRCDRDGFSGCAHPRSDAIAIDFLDGGREVGIVAIRVVVTRTGEGRRGRDGGVHVLGLPRHERNFVAELAVFRIEQWIRNHRAVGPGDRSRIVHAGDHHRRRITSRVGRIDFPSRVVQTVIGSPMVGIRAADLGAGPILERDWEIRRRELLTELR